ncbi:MAG: ABC transporter ATP-binding protein [Treponema sp.]|jgi:peptide/nickel transport system ATP-binding protein|nr:ABC transporter ATP-binding protein [Treponema sp.]
MVKIEYRGVHKDFPVKGKLFKQSNLHAVTNVSFSIEEGHTLALVGESGCGKTTLARLLMKLHEPSSGSILVDGTDIREVRGREALREFRSKIQMIFQDPFGSLNPAHTVGEIIGRAISLHTKGGSKEEKRRQVFELLELVGLTPVEDYIDKHPAQLSGGQRQRIVIARALAVNPSIMVADEPTSMLDVSIGIDIMNLLIELKEKQRLTMMYITHNLASARYMADHMAVMYAGTCVEYGAIDEMIETPYHPYTILLLNSTPEPFRKEKIPIEAKEENPDLISGKPQCMFCGRCPLAQERCFTLEPPETVFEGRRVKCFLYEGKGGRGPLCDESIYAAKEIKAL